MKKVYCTNCKYYYYSGIIRFNGYQPRNPHQCWHVNNQKSANDFRGEFIVLKESANVINQKCDCPYYKRTWWKFWITEIKYE